MSDPVTLLPQERDMFRMKEIRYRTSSGMNLQPFQAQQIKTEATENNTTLVKVSKSFLAQGEEWKLEGVFERDPSTKICSRPKAFTFTKCKNSDELDLGALEVEALRRQALHMGSAF